MNFIETCKNIMNGEKIYNITLRVCFYARVSTDSDVQLNSLENQLNYYENYIKSKPKWIYIKGYVDEGISGVSVEKRESFKEMINDAKLGKFDLIITKEVSRFARDLEDSIHYIRVLKESNVGVYFENQNLNTFDFNSELILNIMFNLAQDESRKLSSRVKFGHREAIKKGHVLGSSNILGYRKDNCKLVIDDNESKLIKKIFELYSSGEYGLYKLSKELGKKGFYNKKGNLYDKNTLKRIIENPKYKGFYRGKTSEIIDYRTKKRIVFDEENQIIYKCNNDIVPAIVSEELWDKCNEILSTRTNNSFGKNSESSSLKYPFSSKIYCLEHNTNFSRSHGSRKKNRPTWSCSQYLQYRLEACVSPIISEKDLYSIMNSIMNSLIPKDSNIICDMLKLYQDTKNTNKYEKELEIIDKEIKIVEDKKTMALDLVFNGEIKRDDLKIQFEHYENELNNLIEEKQEIMNQIEILSKHKNDNKILIDYIEEEINGGSLDEFIRKFVDEVVVSKINDDRYNIKLDIYLNLFDKKHTNKGLKHINGFLENESLYLENIKCDSIELLRSDRKTNTFTYNVYIESL